MKNLFVATILFLFGISAFQAQSQDSKPARLDQKAVEILSSHPNMGFGVTAERPLQGALITYRDLKENHVKVGNYEIVIWGSIVSELTEKGKLVETLKPYLESDITFSVCRMAMDRLGVKEEELLPGLTVVDNAYLRIFELQAQRYSLIIP